MGNKHPVGPLPTPPDGGGIPPPGGSGASSSPRATARVGPDSASLVAGTGSPRVPGASSAAVASSTAVAAVGGGPPSAGVSMASLVDPDPVADILAWQRRYCNDGYFDDADPEDILEFLDERAIAEIGQTWDALAPSAERKPVRWKRGELLGSGAFGKVFLGLNEDDGTLMAAKQIPLSNYASGEEMEELLELMEREITLMSRLRHDNIVQYIGSQRDEYVAPATASRKPSGSGTSPAAGSGAMSVPRSTSEKREEFLTIFMEYVPGGSIASLLKRFGKLNERLVRIYTRQILMGLAYLHAHG